MNFVFQYLIPSNQCSPPQTSYSLYLKVFAYISFIAFFSYVSILCYPWSYLRNVSTYICNYAAITTVVHEFCNLFWKKYLVFGKILTTCFKWYRTSSLPSKYALGLRLVSSLHCWLWTNTTPQKSMLLVKSLQNWCYDNFSQRRARVTKLWSHGKICNIILVIWYI